MNRRKLLILIVSFMIIGFASVSVALFLNGEIRIGSREDDFDVYFSEAIIDGVDKSNLLIADDRKHITFETKILKNPGDSSKLDFEVTNNSTMFGANVSINCISTSELLSVTATPNNMIVEPQTREKGNIVVELITGSSKFVDETITCTLDAVPIEKPVIVERILKDPKYQITGTLTDKDGNPIVNENVVVFSSTPHYVTTDNFGYFYVNDLEKGEHEIYYVGSTNVTNKTKEEIKSLAFDEATTTTASETIKFGKIKLKDFVIEPEKTGKVDINLNPGDGSVSNNKITVNLYSRGNELPTPSLKGYTFKGWLYQGKEVTSDTIINDTKDLTALWEIKKYTITISASDTTASSSSLSLDYNSSAKVTITPATNYYISSVSCTNGYTTNANVGTGATAAQTITISNNGNDSDSVCTINSLIPSYTVTMSLSNVSASTNSFSINYAGNNKITITPSSGYYISSASCTNGYTITGITTGASATGAQTITINNNKKAANSTCTISGYRSNYAATAIGATPVYHTHSGSSSAYGGCYTIADTTSSTCKYGYYRHVRTEFYSEDDPQHNYTDFSQGFCAYHNVWFGGEISWHENEYAQCPYAIVTATGTYSLGCGKTTSTFEYYTCPAGYGLVGAACYTCPYGGTLSGTTCVF